MNPGEAIVAMHERIRQLIAESVKKLLEEKHLYQSIDVKVDDAIGLLAKKVNPSHIEEQLKLNATKFFLGQWVPLGPASTAYGGEVSFPT